MHKSQVFLWCALGLVCGIGLRIFWDGEVFFVGVVVIFVSLVMFFSFWGQVWRIVTVCTAGFFMLGIWRADTFIMQRVHVEHAGKKWEGTITVAAPPQQREAYTLVVGKIDGSVDVAQNQDVRIILRLHRHRDVHYRDILDVRCTLQTPEQFSETFDYQIYLAMQKIYYVCDRPSAKLLVRHGGPYARLLEMRRYFESNINYVIAAPQAGLANGLLFGGDDRLSQTMQEQFARTGMSHIVAVSGYNVSVIAQIMVIVGLAIGLQRRHTFWFASSAILLFIAIIGFPSSGVRAAIMGILVLFALRSGRIGNAINAILCALAAMIVVNPYLIRYDIGFQLSFLATLGIIFSYPLFDHFFVQRAKVMGISEIFFLTLSAHVFVLPVIIYHFKALSVVSLLVNVLVLPILPFTMLLTFFCALFTSVIPVIGTFAGWGAFILLRYEVAVIEYFAQHSWSVVAIEEISPMQIIGYYVATSLVIVFLRKKYDLH